MQARRRCREGDNGCGICYNRRRSELDGCCNLCMAELQLLGGVAVTPCRRLIGDATTPTGGAGIGGWRCCIREVGELQPRRPAIGGAGTMGRRSCIHDAKMLRRASGFARTRESGGCERWCGGATSTAQKCYDGHRVLQEPERAGAMLIGEVELHPRRQNATKGIGFCWNQRAVAARVGTGEA